MLITATGNYFSTTQWSRELSEDDLKVKSAYQNKVQLFKQAEKLNRKSFLQNVHENNSKRARNNDIINQGGR